MGLHQLKSSAEQRKQAKEEENTEKISANYISDKGLTNQNI